MRFLLDTEQRAFADSLRALLTATDTASAVREWSRGERAGGRALWRRFADAGVFGLAVPEARGGWGPRPVEVAVACVESGRHALPGPLAETVGAAVLLASLDDPAPAGRFLPGLLSGESMATLAPAGSYALDAEAAAVRLAVHGAGGAARPPAGRGTGLAEVRLAPAPAGSRPSLDPARRLSLLPSGGEVLASGPGSARPWSTRSPGPGSPPPPRPSAPGSPCWTGRSRTSGGAPSSACPSARSRRSSTASPTR